MALQLHVPGTVHILTLTSSGQTLEELGVSQDGVTLQLMTEFEDVFTDHFGPKTPFDRQYFLQGVLIKVELIWYDKTVLYKWLQGIPNFTTFGNAGNAGDLVVQNSLAKRVVLRNTPQGTGLTTVEDCWNFFNCILVDQHEVKLGVQKSIWNLTFQALYNQQASASLGAGLFNNSCV